MPRFKDERMQRLYSTCRQLGAAGKMGVIHGSTDDHYQRGLKGFPWKGARNTLGYAAWAAGHADHRIIAASMRGHR